MFQLRTQGHSVELKWSYFPLRKGLYSLHETERVLKDRCSVDCGRISCELIVKCSFHELRWKKDF